MKKLVTAVLPLLAGLAVLSLPVNAGGKLADVLASQPDEVKARYQYRHPQETLEFFGIKPGMTVMEVLPGSGWYTKILLPYLGEKGHLAGADYALDMFPRFGFYTDEMLEAKKTWAVDWAARASGWHDSGAASVSAFALGSMPDSFRGKADAVLFIRALHNLNRFEPEGSYLTTALKEAYAALKPGGIAGVVQHAADESMPDEWANGSAGYLKKSLVIDRLTAAGFEFVAESNINRNPADKPTADDIVWRLPPTYHGSKDKPGQKAKFAAIGESDRITLKFRKPE